MISSRQLPGGQHDHGRGAPHAGGQPAGRIVPPPVPSWAAVLSTTLRLWFQRRLPGRRRAALALAAAVAGCLAVALIAVAVNGTGAARTAAAAPGGPGPGPGAAGPGQGAAGQGNASGQGGPGQGGGSAALAAVQASRLKAAAWIAAQVSNAAEIGCDPVMCAAIQARGFPAANLAPLGPSSGDPLGAAIVVATAAVRGQFGSRLSRVYAPLVLASFGSGAARIDVRAAAAGGGAAYLKMVGSDMAMRRRAGAALAANPRLATAVAARRQLTAGLVDSRLLMSLAGLTTERPVRVLAFADAGPGASPAVPLRSAQFAVPATGPGSRRYLQWLLEFLSQQQPPLKAAGVRVARLAGNSVVNVRFSAPSPLGLVVGYP